MSERIAITDSSNQTRGYITTGSDGRQTLTDVHNQTKGYYDPSANRTTNVHNQTVSNSGNVLAALLAAFGK